jgi:hypothetical protein
MMFVGGVVSVIDRMLVLFLLCKSYGAGFLLPLGVILAIFLTNSSNTSQLLAKLCPLSICISLFVQTNEASTCMFICQSYTDIHIDGHVDVFFQKLFVNRVSLYRAKLIVTIAILFRRSQFFLFVLSPKLYVAFDSLSLYVHCTMLLIFRKIICLFVKVAGIARL